VGGGGAKGKREGDGGSASTMRSDGITEDSIFKILLSYNFSNKINICIL
jgi:hypothetical protein